MKVVTTLMQVTGIVLVVLGFVFLSPLSDLLPVDIIPHLLNPFGSAPGTVYYRIVPVEHSIWVETILIVVGAVLFALSRYLKRHQKV
jgi:hypothetical protein